MNIIITGYHHPQSVITQYTRPNSPLQCHSECLGPLSQSGPRVWLSTNQITRSAPGLHLAAILAALGEAALWHPDTECCHTLTSLAHKNCIQVYLSTRFIETILYERVMSFSQNKREKFIYSVWMQRSELTSVVVRGRVSYLDSSQENLTSNDSSLDFS